MRATPTNATLPQLLNRFQAVWTDGKDGELNDLILLTHHLTAIEESCLTLDQTRSVMQNGKLILGQPLTEQWRTIDHHQALEQILAIASQHKPLNRIALQDIIATLMQQTGGPTYSLLSHFDTCKGDFRNDSVLWLAGA